MRVDQMIVDDVGLDDGIANAGRKEIRFTFTIAEQASRLKVRSKL